MVRETIVLSIKVDETFRSYVQDIVDNPAIATGAKGAVKQLMRIIDEHECKCSCGKKHTN